MRNKRIIQVLSVVGLVCLLVLYATTQYDTYGSQWAIFKSYNPTMMTNITSQPPGKETNVMLPCIGNTTKTVGAITVSQVIPSWRTLEQKLTNMMNSSGVSLSTTKQQHMNTIRDQRGGDALHIWSPVVCRPSQLVAVIIPYRKRDEHLRLFVQHMHPFLRHQQRSYVIFVIEQLGDSKFNRAALFNVGFLEASRLAQFDCFIFHDVDLLPEDDRLPYQCRDQPVHLSAAINKHNYRLPYASIFGGAVTMSRSQVIKVRGFSNVFFGWGGEDDDMSHRLVMSGYKLYRHPADISRYIMIKHQRDSLNEINPQRSLQSHQTTADFTI